MNTLVNFRPAQPSKTDQFSAGANRQKVIDTGEMANASELARRFKRDPGWVSEVLRMTRLAPDIIRAILEGRQPRRPNLHAMRGRQAEVPLDWDAQCRLFEFIPPKGWAPTCVAHGWRPLHVENRIFSTHV